ncbi:hypothetical protein KVE53_07130 [Helicobacter pylori]|nr:hypothetical protein KVE53_07130 [Helicobacter pylori]
MIKFARIPLKDFIKKHNPQEPKKETTENFEKEINSLLENAKRQDDEEFQKNEINSFLKNTYDYHCNTYEKVDSAIYVDKEACVLIEVKALNNRNEFPKDRENPLSKAFCQMVFYFLKEIESNNSLKHAIICNKHEFFLFDCKDLLNLFQNDKKITKLHKNCAKKEGTDPSTKRFYSDLEEYLKKDFKGELRYTHFNLSSNDPKEELPLIYQVLSHEVLLKQRKTLDANTLNKDFYEELLYILGLEEQNDKGKILIKPSRTQNSLSDALKKEYNNLDDEEVMALLIAWNNRILFLRLLESLLISFKHFDKPFLTIGNFTNFNALNTLFFEVLAKKNNERLKEIKEDKILGKIPYLNSSLFDKTPLESNGHEIKLLNNEPLEIYPKSVLKKDKDYQNKKDLPLLKYLFEFLHAYDFTTTPKDIKDNKNTSESRLINPSVLGLVFEKLNGYKEGSFYTPSFITSYMCSESITPIVLDKFNAIYEWDCKDLEALRGKIDRNFSDQKAKEYLQLLLALRICDPAVGSGHFLVSALNEMVRIAYELGLITSLYRHSLRLENDEIIIMELNALKVFESAAVDTSIMSFIKQTPPKESRFNYYEPNPDDKNDLKSARSFSMKQNALSTESFIFADSTLLNLRDKMESVGTPLKDWDIQIYRGILTGANEAFIIPTEKREEILNACKTQEERKRTEALIKPILRGKDIKRYSYEWAGEWVINTHNGYTSNLKFKIPPIDIEKYPATKVHLNSHYDTIATRSDQGDTPYHLRNCAYLEDFEKEKIVYGEIVQEPRFYLDNGECELGYFYAEATSFILTGEHLRYLLGMLHSKLITFAFKTFYAGGGLGESGYRYKKAFIERLPIPKITPQNQKLADKIIVLVDKILKSKEKDPKANTQQLEKEIDALVYQLYNLTDEEIKIIEEGQ